MTKDAISDWNKKNFVFVSNVSANEILEFFNNNLTSKELSEFVIELILEHDDLFNAVYDWMKGFDR